MRIIVFGVKIKGTISDHISIKEGFDVINLLLISTVVKQMHYCLIGSFSRLLSVRRRPLGIILVIDVYIYLIKKIVKK